MIEFCSKKRMVFAIAILTGLSVVVLIIESKYSLHHNMQNDGHIQVNDSCGNPNKWKEIESCKKCNDYEMKFEYCKDTGYYRKVKCVDDTQLSKSCPKLSADEERKFWIFEIVMAVVGVTSYSVVYIRQRRLDKLLMEKVHKQIAAGV